MKKLFALLCIAIAIAACSGPAKKETAPTPETRQPLAYGTLEIKDTIPLDERSEDSPTLNIDISLEVPQDTTEVARHINAAIATTAFGYANMQPQKAAEEMINALKSEYMDLRDIYLNEKAAGSYMGWLNNYCQIIGKVEEGKDGTICYSVFTEQFSGGAHPYSSVSYTNLYKDSGYEVTLDDIFKDGYEGTLTDMLVARLAEMNNVSTIEELNEIGYLTIADMFITSNFRLKQDSIIFHYNKYDIAPYALGESCIGFKYDELKEILK